MNEKFISMREFGVMRGISHTTVSRLIKEGKLKFIEGKGIPYDEVINHFVETTLKPYRKKGYILLTLDADKRKEEVKKDKFFSKCTDFRNIEDLYLQIIGAIEDNKEITKEEQADYNTLVLKEFIKKYRTLMLNQIGKVMFEEEESIKKLPLDLLQQMLLNEKITSEYPDILKEVMKEIQPIFHVSMEDGIKKIMDDLYLFGYDEKKNKQYLLKRESLTNDFLNETGPTYNMFFYNQKGEEDPATLYMLPELKEKVKSKNKIEKELAIARKVLTKGFYTIVPENSTLLLELLFADICKNVCIKQSEYDKLNEITKKILNSNKNIEVKILKG